MCVQPAWRGRGVASALLDELVEWIEGNAPDAYVSMIGLPHARGMYERRGFRETAGVGMARARWGRMGGGE